MKHIESSALLGVFSLAFFAAPAVFAYDADIGWVTNSYFAASVKESEGQYVNGDWSLNAPTTNAASFSIDSTQTVFTVAQSGITATRKVVKVDCDFDYSDFYYLDDLTNDVASAIAAISLVTNEETGAMSWMAVKEGDTWVNLAGAAATVGSYKTRVELDYTTAAQPLVRYSVSNATLAAWTVLQEGETSWFNTAASAVVMSNVCFAGKTTLASIDAKLSTTAAAEVNGQDCATVLAAIDAAKTSGKTIVLYKDVAVASADLRGTRANATYTFNENGKALTFTQTEWKSSDATGVEASYADSTITVGAEKALVAKIVNGDTDKAYLTLGEAFAAGDGKTVVVITNFAESATLDGAKVVTLDLAGFTVIPGDASKPVIVADDANTKLFVFGGAITGATAAAAISATDGAVVTIDELVATNNAKALLVTGGSSVVISNGLFTGAFDADGDTSKINILGGYIVAQKDGDVSFASGKVKATGGKFTNLAKTAGDTASITNVGYTFTGFAVPFVTNDVSFAYEVMPIVTNASGTVVETSVYTVTNENGEAAIGGVQVEDSFADSLLPEAEKGQAAKRAEALSKPAKYPGMQNWQCYVLGVTNTESATEGPYVKGVQDDKIGKIGFSVLTPAAIKAAESGCDVKFTVTPYADPEFKTGAGDESAKTAYDKTVELDVPGDNKVRYYKLKMYISTKK